MSAGQDKILDELVEELVGLEELDWDVAGGDCFQIMGDSTFIELRNTQNRKSLELLVNGQPMDISAEQRTKLYNAFHEFRAHMEERSMAKALADIRLLKKRKEDF